MHALELAKTTWNAVITQGEAVPSRNTVKDAQLYLTIARGILENFGPEGDEGGPLEEIEVLQGLLNGPEHM